MPAGLPYGVPAYWDARYTHQTPENFTADEWYGAAGVAAVLGAVRALNLPPGARALEVGCGGGRLAETLAAELGLRLTATDISPVAVARREGKDSAALVTWAVADAAALPFPDGAFSLVLDKGVCDALDCADDDDAADAAADDGAGRGGTPTSSRAALVEAARVLAPGGSLVLASCRDPAARAPLLEGLFEASGAVVEVWAAVEAGRARPPCPEAYVYTLVPVDLKE